MKRLSIKLRVTLWFTLFMLLLVGFVLGLMFWEGEREIHLNTKHFLTDTVIDSLEQIESDDGRLEIDDDFDYFQDGVYLTLYNAQGELLFGRMPAHMHDFAPLEEGGCRVVTDENANEWYVYDVSYTLGGGQNVWVRGLIHEDSGEDALAVMRYLSLIALPFLVLLGTVGGYLLANRAFRPVRRITASAEKIAEGNDLNERIGLVGGNDEIHNLAATFDGMLERLEKSFERERQFNSDVSHELKTPVSVILSSCEVALESAKTKEEAIETLTVIQKQAERISSIISKLLFLSRADRGKAVFLPEDVSLSELSETVAEQMREIATEKGMTLECNIAPDLFVLADETMLIRVLINLLDNAIKYGRTKICLHLFAQDGAVICEVADDGIGIEEKHLDKIWNRFYQVDPARSSEKDGVGLGLSMVKFIIESHGGSVFVESELGSGSRFGFALPRKK